MSGSTSLINRLLTNNYSYYNPQASLANHRTKQYLPNHDNHAVLMGLVKYLSAADYSDFVGVGGYWIGDRLRSVKVRVYNKGAF